MTHSESGDTDAIDPGDASRTEDPAGRTEAAAAEDAATSENASGADSVPQQRATPRADQGPVSPTQLNRTSWWRAAKHSVRQMNDDKLTTWAAALTYYAILSIFPGLLVLISALRLFGSATTTRVLRNLTDTAPGPAQAVLKSAVTNLQNGQQSTAGVVAIIGLLAALWSSSGYVGSFMQAANSIYDVPEGRPIWKKLPIRLAITVVAGIIVAAGALAVVFTGSLAQQLGRILNLGSSVVNVWDIAKWPVLVLLISLLLAVMYWAAPNAKQAGFRWVTPGSLLATLIWVAASALFALYVANFSSYNKTYGSLAAIIVFLIWLWITNLAILLGAEFDAELQRSRAIEAGLPVDDEPYMSLRDHRKVRSGQSEDL